jgi:hypothetical protein
VENSALPRGCAGPGSPQLVFDPTANRYYLNNEPVPNVTRILRTAGLIDYSFLDGEHRERCLALGRAVHEATQCDDQGFLTEVSISADVVNYLEAWRAFRRDFRFEPDLIEHTVYHQQLHYCGRLDRVGRTHRGETFIVDIKTGTALPWTAVQLAAYSACLEHPRTRLRRCVELHADGSYRVIPYETRNYRRDLNAFIEALRTFLSTEEEK